MKQEPLYWIESYDDLLNELRCADHPEHRVEAARMLVDEVNQQDRIAYLLNAAIYDPDPEAKDGILRILFDYFGNKLYEMIDLEKSDGIPIEGPWLTPCTEFGNHAELKPIMNSELDYASLLKEIRCEESAQHRIEAAKKLITFTKNPQRIAYLINVVLYDPDPAVKTQIKTLLFNLYGAELETMIKVEASDQTPIEDPWMLPCVLGNSDHLEEEQLLNLDDLDELIRANNIKALQIVLRDANDADRRLKAAKALAIDRSDENLTLLAKAAVYDPDEQVQNQVYQSLYQAAGQARADSLINEICADENDERDKWLLQPDELVNTEYPQESSENNDSLFGINKADQIRGMVNLFTGEVDPQKRIAILNAMAKSTNVNANESIARVGLFDANDKVRESAKVILAERLGDSLDDFLEHIYNKASPYLPDPEDVEGIESINDDEPKDDFSAQLRSQPSVISEGTNWKPLVILSVIVIVGMILYLLLR